MMNLLVNMDLRNLNDNFLAKAENEIESYYSPAKAGGNSLNRNAALAHPKGGNSLNRNAALAHSINDKHQIGFSQKIK